MKRLIGMSLLLVFALILAACTSSAATPTATAAATNPTASSTTAAISIKGFAFEPATMTVKEGTTLTWTNNDSVDHTVTSDTGLFDSGNMAPGDTFNFTFATAGTYPYHCTLHAPNMVGTIVVTK